jgi:diketogulonate reductase-like aldo/keto reductase
MKTIDDIFRLSKTPAQILIRWSVQHGFITIPKTSQKDRLQSIVEILDKLKATCIENLQTEQETIYYYHASLLSTLTLSHHWLV